MKNISNKVYNFNCVVLAFYFPFNSFPWKNEIFCKKNYQKSLANFVLKFYTKPSKKHLLRRYLNQLDQNVTNLKRRVSIRLKRKPTKWWLELFDGQQMVDQRFFFDKNCFSMLPSAVCHLSNIVVLAIIFFLST
jgi:hypothetical protein